MRQNRSGEIQLPLGSTRGGRASMNRMTSRFILERVRGSREFVFRFAGTLDSWEYLRWVSLSVSFRWHSVSQKLGKF